MIVWIQDINIYTAVFQGNEGNSHLIHFLFLPTNQGNWLYNLLFNSLSAAIPLSLKINLGWRSLLVLAFTHLFIFFQPLLCLWAFSIYAHQLTTANPSAHSFITLDAVKVIHNVNKILITLLLHKSVTVSSLQVCPPPNRRVHGLAVNYIPSPSQKKKKKKPPPPWQGRQQSPVSLSDLYPLSAARMGGAVSLKLQLARARQSPL